MTQEMDGESRAKETRDKKNESLTAPEVITKKFDKVKTDVVK